jgi:hypothetical protein
MQGLWTKIGLVLAVAMLATAAVVLTSDSESGSGASSQAVTWNPDNAPVVGNATDPGLSYGSVKVLCATGKLAASTGQESHKIARAVVGFSGPCTLAGQDATVACDDGSRTLDLIARTGDPPGGSGEVALKSDFECELTIQGLCTITLAGPQTARGGFTLNEADEALTFDARFAASRAGSPLCGPREGTINWQSRFDTRSLTIDS